MTFLKFHLNACPICLICLDCQNIYGQECICQAKEIVWKRKKVEHDYVIDFCHKPLSQQDATNQKVVLDLGFADWVFANISSQIELLSIPNNVNICQKCMKRYHGKKNENCIAVKDDCIIVREDCIIVKENCIDSTGLESTMLPSISVLIPSPPNNVQPMKIKAVLHK
ncbi:uncharacterized protein OCT59_022393 [Rhizophagus irregularis]|uniref:Uncharacterized protein n=2 Tax=Rhizophagus irregularis TaxID=588596 RepID=A0A015IQJ3_RHIIW|nr:hypothetical protein GLOIN_2v1783223 [Rhizophagus irregularis DAOM 181602=DAOM 197198]EXX56510.1 hypothetical protein RirG_215490 [Rhizophagus irregularis DAOM 197198w]POG64154.1 hypothetical protein GLOIN_2v1783223 [Rhizophagus irregularis DAOM 181602=DAOM 197198]UZO28887.1 hypothetical protein OCT59_022393 [Rhizophagus irregularis]GBC51149.1 hypothetical protein GLOIN_2v1783223 [Rhizophagus irregularis DAOM 181602=DAOM 197198]|eukprot:XP_025171020.1 hypothetical protein GLOIN_2v1783223 [Rhizophagus irregularis DAOM 181602=DAOM 197198]